MNLFVLTNHFSNTFYTYTIKKQISFNKESPKSVPKTTILKIYEDVLKFLLIKNRYFVKNS